MSALTPTDRATGPRDPSAPVAVIFGASGGIGSEVARQLARTGGRLMLVARSEERLAALASETSAGRLACDVTVPAQARAVLPRALELHGRIDPVAHCAGSFVLKPAHATTDADWESTLAINLSSALHALGRIGEPADVASAICWLIAPAQSWITGHVLAVDGGRGSIQPRAT